MTLPPSPVATAGPPDDLDGDGVPNRADDCLYVPDADQRDADRDGFGNRCDPDVDQDGVVTTSWGRVEPPGDLERILLTAQPGGKADGVCDLDGDGKVDDVDVGLAQLWLFLPPGPRGSASGPGAPGR